MANEYDFSKLTQRQEEPTFTPLPMIMEEAAKTNPAQFAESSRISRLTGIPIESVESDLPGSRAYAKAVQYDLTKLVQRSPVTGEFLRSYQNSVFAQNDVTTLEDIERVFNESASRTTATEHLSAIGRSIPGGAVQGIGMGVGGIGRTIEAGGRTMQRVADFLLPEQADRFIWENPADKYLQYVDPATFLRARGEGTQQLADMIMPAKEDQNLATSVAAGVGQVLGQAVAYSLSPNAAMVGMFGQGVEIQGQRQDATGTYGESFTSDLALITGGMAEMALERTGVEALLNRIPPNIRNDAARAAADVFMAGGIEGIQEVVEGMTQSIIERFSTNPDAPLLEGALEEGTVGFSVGAIVRALILTATPGKLGVAATNEQSILQRGKQDQVTLDQISELVGSTEVRQLSQESFQEFVTRLNGEAEANVYIDSAQLSLYLNEQKNKAVPDPALILLSEQAGEAAASGTAVSIPFQDFATIIAATPHYDALRDAMTLSPEAVPVYRQEQASWEAENYMTRLVEEAKANASQYVEAQELYNSIKDQLVDTGRVTPRNAATMAQIVPAWAAVYAQKTGKSIAEVYAESGLTVVGPQTGKKASLAQRAVDAVRDVFGLNEPVVAEPNEYQVPEQGVSVRDTNLGKTYTTPDGATISVLEDSQYSPRPNSVTDFVVPEDKRGQGVGGRLLNQIFQRYNPATISAAASSQPSVALFYKNGFRPIMEPDATLERSFEIMQEESSVTMVIPDAAISLAQSAFHGTPHRFDRFSLEAIGTGEGAQAYGWGLYFAGRKEVAEWYRDELTARNNYSLMRADGEKFTYKNPGAESFAEIYLISSRGDYAAAKKDILELVDRTTRSPQMYLDSIAVLEKWEAEGVIASSGVEGQLYQVNLPEDSELLDWDALIEEQPTKVTAALEASEYWQYAQERLEDRAAATGRNVTGRDIYRDLLDDMEPHEASLYLNSLGIPGLKYLDGSSRRAGEGSSNYVIWDESRVTIEAVNDQMVEAENYVKELGQKGARGYYEPDNSIIRLTEASDLSTFLHEFGHFMLEMEKKVGGDTWKNIGKWYKRNADDVAAEANGWLGDTQATVTVTVVPDDVIAYVDNGTTGDKLKDRALYVATHEQFARAWEQYLMEGKAPSTELHNIFQTFARWMVELYQKIKGGLRVNLDDEMRQVLDRMIATEEQIKAAEARAKIAPLFTDAAMAGMTEEAYLKYLEDEKKVGNKAAETLRDKLIKQLTRQTETWWLKERDDLMLEIGNELKATRTYRTIAQLRDGEMKLDKAAVKEMVGDLRISVRGVEFSAVPRQLNNMTLDGARGVHPDEAAVFFGYSSGSEMLNDIMKAEPIAKVAEAAADQAMLRRHGDILNDGSIQREADEALQNEEQAKLILKELKALNHQVNLDRTNIRDMAVQKISTLSYREINPQKYRAAELRAAQEAVRMLAEGNQQGAADAKMRQLMNHHLARAAMDARKAIESIQEGMSRYSTKSVRENIMRAENGYWGQIEKILNRFEFRKSATLKSVDKANESINTWAKDRIENDGDQIILSDAVADETYVTHWKNVPFAELQGIADTVKNLEHVARYANKIRYLGEQRDFNEMVDLWTGSIDAKVTSVWEPKIINTVQKESVKRKAKWSMAGLTKIPYMMSWLDGMERVGMSHELISQRMNDALDNEFNLFKEVATPVIEAIKNLSNADRKRHMRDIYIEEIGETIKGNQVLAVALNVGNAGNLRKLLLGEGWADPRDEASISLNNPKLQAVLKHMTKGDWELVQKIWDQMDKLYPMLEEVHRRSTGLTPTRIEAVPVQTPFGEFRGGYYPLKSDPNRSEKASRQQQKSDAETDSMFSTFGSIHASVTSSATQERTGVYYPLDLNLDVVPNHFQEVIHFITHHDAVRQVNKLLNNEKVAMSIKKALGPDEFALLRPWLHDVAKDGRQSVTKSVMDPWFARLRFGVTLGVMGFKATTALIQLSGLSNAISETGLGNFKKAIRMILSSPSDMENAREFSFNRSKVLKHRMQTMDREMRNVLDTLQGKRGLLAAVQEASMKHIAFVQTYMVDIPSWYAGYVAEMERSGDEVKAAQYGDWVIEQIQGSGATKDMSALMRDPSKATRLFTMFMTFFSSLWNQERDLIRGARGKQYSTTTVAAKLTFMFTIPVLIDMLLRGEFGDDEDDEDSNIQDMLTTTAMYGIGGVPFIRDIANGVIGDYGYSMTPIARVIEAGTYGLPKVMKGAFTDEEITKAQAKASTEFVGAMVGIPGISQAWITGEELYDVLVEGEELSFRELFLFRGEE